MGEGNTPLIHTDRLGAFYSMKNLYLKNETLNPSGTYKDRFATVAMTLAKEDGIKQVAIGSAGNAAAAVALTRPRRIWSASSCFRRER